jgi:hypothetical protein
MPEDIVSRRDLQTLSDRVTSIVDRLNEVNQHGREYVDAANKEQDNAMTAMEKSLVDKFDKMLQDHDKAIRKFISQEADKVSKSLKKR